MIVDLRERTRAGGAAITGVTRNEVRLHRRAGRWRVVGFTVVPGGDAAMSRSLARSYAAIWAATAIGAMSGDPGSAPARGGGAVRRAHADTLDRGRAAQRQRRRRSLAAGLAVARMGPAAVRRRRSPMCSIRAQLLGNGLIAGNALGQHPRLALYLPHLPLEWLAIAIPVAAWQSARDGQRTARLRATAATVAALVAAALIETYLVPVA